MPSAPGYIGIAKRSGPISVNSEVQRSIVGTTTRSLVLIEEDLHRQLLRQVLARQPPCATRQGIATTAAASELSSRGSVKIDYQPTAAHI
jgi:hypothetical protein